MHVRDIDRSKLTATEKYILDLMDDRQTGFFPISQALVIPKEDKDDSGISELADQIKELTRRMDEINEKLAGITSK